MYIKVWIFQGEIIPGEESLPITDNRNKPARKKPRRQKFEDRSE